MIKNLKKDYSHWFLPICWIIALIGLYFVNKGLMICVAFGLIIITIVLVIGYNIQQDN